MKSNKGLLRFLISFILILLIFYLSASVVSAARFLDENTVEYIIQHLNLEVDIYNYFYNFSFSV